MDKKRVKIFTRSANVELYNYSQRLIDLPYKRVRLYGTTADGYFYQMLEDTDCDIAINIDEDAFVVDNSALEELLEHVIENDIVCCGMRDGGIVYIRILNPIVQNPFFNIINLRAIREKFNREAIEAFDYEANKEELIKQLPKELQNYEGLKYDNYEPYYHFFLWMAKNFKIMYLNAEQHQDQYTTILYNQNYKPILYHTWFSRDFGKDEKQTDRIQSIIVEAYTAQGMKAPRMPIVKVRRWFENKRQELVIWWKQWTKIGGGRWLYSHLARSL